MKEKTKGLVEIHIAVFLFGLAGLFGKYLAISPFIIVLGRVFFAVLFLLLIIRFFKESLRLKSIVDYWWMGLLGLILVAHWVTFFQSIQISTVAIGLLTYATFPIFVVFLEPWFFRERLRVRDVVVAFVTFMGVVIVIPKFDLANDVFQGVLWGMASSVTFALLAMLNRKYVQRYSSTIVAFYQDAVATILLLPFLFILQPVLTTRDILLLVLLGVVFTGIAHTLYIKGMTYIKARVAGILAALEPVYGIVFAALLLNEIPNLRVLIGGAVILGATTYETYSSSRS